MQHTPGFLAAIERIKHLVHERSVDEVAAMQTRGEAFVFVDVREDNEWLAGHAQGAVHIGRGVLERDVETKIPDKTTPVVLYCGGGYRSALAAVSLQDMGYQTVWSMAGGIRAWRAAKLPEQG